MSDPLREAPRWAAGKKNWENVPQLVRRKKVERGKRKRAIWC